MTYDEMIPLIAAGSRHTDGRWPTWFSQVGGVTLEERIRNVFNVSGRVPTRAQFEAAQAMMPEPEPPEIVVEVSYSDPSTEVATTLEIRSNPVAGDDEGYDPADAPKPKPKRTRKPKAAPTGAGQVEMSPAPPRPKATSKPPPPPSK